MFYGHFGDYGLRDDNNSNKSVSVPVHDDTLGERSVYDEKRDPKDATIRSVKLDARETL